MKCHKEDAPLLGLMGQSMRLIGKRAQELYAEYDLNRAQSGILFALHQEDSMSQKELAKRLNVTPPSITSMIKKMEQEGYITRKADEHGPESDAPDSCTERERQHCLCDQDS